MAAIDLSENVANQLMTETVGNIQNTNAEARNSNQLANAHLRFAAVTKFNELGPVESRSVAGVMASPIAGPTTAQPAP